jgi:hypothetical protein
MLFRIACVLIATLTLQSPAVAQAEEEVVAAIRARLDANRRHDKDAGGRVTHYVYHDLGATDRIVRKIK